eukprot:CAMPEP_0113516984 /NCGR_PEP_ID=MMETSP0014_2-20120614/41940_1 /TAXON_ID=2857 /ORGANISM="Nitzschia sp." /LENGTH=165 /DNA_ID=CAMNT_0000413997 /DNA_START=330 /DNA_END=827 /DNA_ORIENTATION=- /assembly_acc=CAM_ASM_000159
MICLTVVLRKLPSSSHSSWISILVLSPTFFSLVVYSFCGGAQPLPLYAARTALTPGAGATYDPGVVLAAAAAAPPDPPVADVAAGAGAGAGAGTGVGAGAGEAAGGAEAGVSDVELFIVGIGFSGGDPVGVFEDPSVAVFDVVSALDFDAGGGGGGVLVAVVVAG